MLFPFRPEKPLVERLRFKTDVIEAKDGTEQRIALRSVPRQEFDFNLSLEKIERRIIDNILFGSQTDTFELPIWTEPQFLSAPAAASDTTVLLTSSILSYWSFRDGDSVLIWQDDDNYQLLENAELVGNALSFDTPLDADYIIGSEILAIRPALLASEASVSRYPINLTDYAMTFAMLDNQLLYTTPTFDTFGGKYILTGPNAIDSKLAEGFNRQLYICDGDTGTFSPTSFWDRSRRTTVKTFKTVSREALWNVRNFVYTIRGRQVSFLLPTFGEDFIASDNLLTAGSTITVENVGYATQVDARTPRNIIRVVTRAGVVYTRTIVSAVEDDEDNETLTVNAPWGADINVADILNIDVVEKVRVDSEDIVVTHEDTMGTASVSFPVRSVIE